ncbi:MAG: hypothetical protein V4646_01950 [Pseudomonadota bacterium]
MTAYLLTNHLLNFIAPAAFVALLLILLAQFFGRFFKRKRPAIVSWRAQLAIIFVVNLTILAAGLVILGAEARMATYTALVIGAALCHWMLGRGWKG